MFQPETVHRLALDKPNEAACVVDAWRGEKIVGCALSNN
jgi:hypothetical protein